MFFDGLFDFNDNGSMDLWEQDLEYAAYNSTMEDDDLEMDDDYDEFDE